jgi:signal transduction histidine kinase
LIIKDEDYGAITLYYREAREFSEEESRLASSVAHQAALAIESARLREQAEQTAAMAERSRLARELHDSVTQSLYSIMLYAEAGARALAEGDQAPAVEYLQELRDTAQEALREMRLLIFELRPLALEKIGLVAALQARLEAVETRSGMQTDFRIAGADAVARLSFTMQDELYHIVHEALNNVLKHSNAKHVQVDLQIQDTNVHLEICDDGVGFTRMSNGTAGGLGLSSMKERAQRLDGQLHIESSPGHGTGVFVDVPINPAHLSDTVLHSS